LNFRSRVLDILQTWDDQRRGGRRLPQQKL